MLFRSTYTVFLSWRSSLEENSQRTSRKARLGGGYSAPFGFWYLKANSIPSLRMTETCMRGRIKKRKSLCCMILNNSSLNWSYLCSVATASLVLIWSNPKVRAKRRASSLMPLTWDEVLSKLGPWSWISSLKSWGTEQIMGLLQWSKMKMWGLICCDLTCCKLKMSVLAHSILSVCLVLLRVSLMMSP